MTANDTLRSDPVDDGFEALLRSRLHQLAEHAPTTVRAVDELSVRRARATEARSRRWLGIAASVAVLAGATAVTLVVSGRSDVAGAASPEDAVAGLVQALENSDVLGAIDLLDPVEVPALRAAVDSVRTAAAKIGAIRDDLSLDGVKGLDIDIADLTLSTELLAPDLAVVTPSGGSITASVDPQSFPFGSEVVAAIGPDAAPVDATSELGLDTSELHVATVQRDGRWYVSAQYTLIENVRQSSDDPRPFPTEAPVVPTGSPTPQAAATALLQALVGADAAALARTFAPGEGDAVLRYAPLWVPALQGAFGDAAGGEAQLSDLSFTVTGEGDRQRLDPVGYTIEGTLDASQVGYSPAPRDPAQRTVVYLASGTELVVLPAGVPVPATADELADYEVLDASTFTFDEAMNVTFVNTDGTVMPLAEPTDGDSSDEPVPYRLQRDGTCLTVTGEDAAITYGVRYATDATMVDADTWKSCTNMTADAIFGLGLLGTGVVNQPSLPPLEVVQVDGQWYVSPIGTVGVAIAGLFASSNAGATLIDAPLASFVYGFDRQMLASFTQGQRASDLADGCADLVDADADGTVVGVRSTLDQEALRRCAQSVRDGGWAT